MLSAKHSCDYSHTYHVMSRTEWFHNGLVSITSKPLNNHLQHHTSTRQQTVTAILKTEKAKGYHGMFFFRKYDPKSPVTLNSHERIKTEWTVAQ